MNGDMQTAFSDALERAGSAADSSPESTPAETTTTDVTTPEAPAESTEAVAATETTPPASAATDQTVGGQSPSEQSDATQEKPEGEPPKWRWQDILANARETSSKEGREAALRELGLESDARPEQIRQAIQLAQWLERDPVSATAWLSQQVQQTQPAEEPEPQPDAAIKTPDGRQVPVFTPEGMRRWQTWNERRLTQHLEQSLGEKFKPAMTMAEQLQQAAEQAQRQQQIHQWADQTLAPLARSPLFEEFKPELQKVVADPSIPEDKLVEALHNKFWALHQAKLDALSQSGKTEALAELQSRALAGDANSAAGVAREPKKYSSDEEGFRQALQDFAEAR